MVSLEKKAKERKKVSIVGFAPSWVETPFNDPEMEFWCLNEMYKLFATKLDLNPKASRWFEIHSRNSPSKNKPEHIKWLQECKIPLYMWEHYDDMPNSIPFPKERLVEEFETNYFTNTISWMVAFAISEGFEEIHVYGVDMAQESEYQWQRPSCEYFLGIAKGLGIKVYIPDDSDLLKTSQLYGFETDNAMRLKMKGRKKELTDRKKQYEAEYAKYQKACQDCKDAINQINGAIEDINYWMKNWNV